MKTIKSDGIERRAMLDIEVELRMDSTGAAPIVSGYASVFDSLSEPLFELDNGRFREKVARGAFAKTIREQNIPLLIEHHDLPLASTGSGTLTLREDEHGLYFESALDASDPDVQRVLPKMRRRDLAKCSFGFVPVRETWDEKARPRVRTLHEVRLYDVSIVARPAYAMTEAKVRKQLADDGLDVESLAEVLVRLRQGLELNDDDMTLLRRLGALVQPYIEGRGDPAPTSATAAEVAPNQTIHPTEAEQPAMSESAPDPVVHPLSWYKQQLDAAKLL